MSTLSRQLSAALRMLLVLTVLCGIAYPLVVLGVGQAVAHDRANGSLVDRDGTVVASMSLGQQVTDPQWFQGRRSASEYAGDTSGGTNLGPNDAKQAQALAEARDALIAANPNADGPPPADALTASASGLDPDISVAYATWQVPRVAAARGLPTDRVQSLVDDHTKGRLLGFLGQPRVNVTELNLALADLATGSRPAI
ncbi:MAG TPA: potassium-transporting ATPase subunit KdpC [Lapillicoccus sp.]|nr:potassium-transporting ATPase subunit KdpC [Lapillicoccus sp.]